MSLGIGALQVGRGARAIQAQQGGIHDNPASGNRPLKFPPTGTVTLKKALVDNTYLTHRPQRTGGVGARIRYDSLKLDTKPLKKAGNQQRAIDPQRSARLLIRKDQHVK